MTTPGQPIAWPTSGANLVGDSPATGAPGNVFPRWNSAGRVWEPATLPSNTGEPWSTLLWVNAQAESGGNGSIDAPFQTVTEAVDAAPEDGAGTAIHVGIGDYSGEADILVGDRQLAFFGEGGAQSTSPEARPILPGLRFEDSTTLFLRNVDASEIIANDDVIATLENVTALLTDNGGGLTVYATGNPETFNGEPQNEINGTCDKAVLSGMLVTDGLVATDSIVSARGRLGADGDGFEADVAIVLYEHEFDPTGAIVDAPNIFLDQWSYFQAQEQEADLSSPASVQELSTLEFFFGAKNVDTAGGNHFLNPNIIFGDAAATAASDWLGAPRDCIVFECSLQLSQALAFDVTATLYTGATLGTLAATTLIVTVPAGQTFAKFGLAPGAALEIPEGHYLAGFLASAGASVANNSLVFKIQAA